ncbi:MAG: lasso peptide biosynthesis B2 protein [Algoriphagus sp.]|nr:lasso peptide biosynthesis B2 protein [Algoriphagus sp.]
MKSLLHKARSFREIPKRRKALFFKVIGLSIFRGYLIIKSSPKAFSEKLVNTATNQTSPTMGQLVKAKDIAFAIQLAAKYIPWSNVCRHQSWQAVYLLTESKIPFTYQVGVKKNSTSDGHSWVMVENIFISGACDLNEYQLLNFS